MRILVNAVPLVGLQTGIGRALRNLYRAVEAADQGDGAVRATYFDGFGVHQRIPPAAKPSVWARRTDALWKLPDPMVTALRVVLQLQYERRLRPLLGSKAFDFYHETAFFPAAQRRVPTVFHLFDFSLDRYAHTHPRERVWFHRLFFRRRLAYASHVVTISRFVMEEARSRLGLEKDRLSVVPLAADAVFFPRSASEIEVVRRQFGLQGPYFLFVGSLEPRKNLRLVWNALQRLKATVPLVLAGWHAWGEKSWLAEALSPSVACTSRVVLTGFVDDATLAALYTGATALVYPSLYEGFGLPVLEAMACGCPVVCSNTSALPETAGDAALYIEPHDADGLANVLERLLTDVAMRETCRSRGLERARAFSWEKSAQAMGYVFRKLISA